jgi:hypothetical protein
MAMMHNYLLRVVGRIWMPDTVAAMDYHLRAECDSDALAMVDTNTGDFQSITDFQLETGDCRHDWRIVKPWDDTEGDGSEMVYGDLMYPEEVDA